MVAGTEQEKALKELAREVKELQANLAKLSNDLGRHDENDRLKHLREQVRSGLDALTSRYDQLKTDSRQAIETTQQKVQERPLASLAIALGVGWILARLLRGGGGR